MRMIHASCLCGGVKFRINGALSQARNCHCSMCRKAHGAAFRSRACGSPVVTRLAHGLYYGVPLGALDDDPRVRPELHVYVASKAPWFTITDDLPQFAAGPI
jgi:hypothetical protein